MKRQLILIITALCLVAGKFCYWWIRALLHLCHVVTFLKWQIILVSRHQRWVQLSVRCD